MKFFVPISGKMDLVARLLCVTASILLLTTVIMGGGEWMSWLSIAMLLLATGLFWKAMPDPPW